MPGQTGSTAPLAPGLNPAILQKFIIEFYKPGTTVALARWDFPIRYDGNGVDEMWVDRAVHGAVVRQGRPRRRRAASIAFSCARARAAPPSTASQLPRFHSLNGLVAREAGTVIATPDIMASMTYYR